MAASPTRPTAESRTRPARPTPSSTVTAAGPAVAIAVAVSGGRDSTALLHCTARAAKATGVRVHALHVHHGLQADADRWARQLAARCRRWARAGLPVTLHLRRLEGAPGPGDSVEAWARRGRYLALAEMARGAGCDSVLLAHHREDQAETVLLQLLRGGGARGLAAMPAAAERDGIRWLRPWLAQPRRAIEAYLARHRLRWVEDASNADPRHARSRLRTRVWPALAQSFTDAAAVLGSAASRAAEEADCLHALADIDAVACVDADGALRVAPWLRLPPARRVNLLRHRLRAWLGRGAPHSLVDRLMDELAPGRVGAWPSPRGVLRLYRGRLLVHGPAVSAPARAGAAAQPGGAGEAAPGLADDLTRLPAGRTAGEGTGDGTPAAAELALDLRRPGHYPLTGWGGALVVRDVAEGGVALCRLADVRVTPRRAGDRFQCHADGPPRVLKKQFQSLGVPAWRRDGPVLRDVDGEPLFVAGLGLDARARAPVGRPQRAVSWMPDAGR